MHSGGIDGMNSVNTRHYAWNDRAGQLVDEIAEASIFLRRPAYHGERPNRTGTMINPFDAQYRKIVDQTVIAQMIAERSFRQQSLWIHRAANAEIRLGRNGQTNRSVLACRPNQRDAAAAQETGEYQLRHSFRQRHDGSYRQGWRTT